MHDNEGTTVMTLGRVGRGLGAAQIAPQWGYNPMPGHRTSSPNQPQNLPRPTLQNGPHALGRIVGNVVQVTNQGNLGTLMGLGAADGPADAPQPPPAVDDPLDVHRPYDPYAGGVAQGWLTPGQADAYRTWGRVMVYVRPISSTASFYHGYKRNGGSLGWGIGWMILGGLFPLLTPTVGVAQGWGKRKSR